MGKTPERVHGTSAAPVMRYRRKVLPPVAEASPTGAGQQPVDGGTKRQQDNQAEHHEAEPIAGDSKSEPLQQTPMQKPLNPGGPARKKKPKAHTNVKDAAGTADNASTAPVTPTTVEGTSSHAPLAKKKAKKRQLPSNNAGEEPEVVEPCPQPESSNHGTEPVKLKPFKQNSNRKHKNDVNNGKHKGPSLLKQLLWKAKPVAPPPVSSESSLSSDSTSPDAGVSLQPADTTHQKQSKANRSSRPNIEDKEEQEEVEYTVSERHHRKLQASQNAVESQACCATPVVCGELSSQETQSGSDDDEASPSFLSVYENLVPTDAIEPKDLSTAVQLQSFYPTPFPLALAADSELLKQHGIKVHEVLIEDFAFHPTQLRVQPGDVVLWKVSVQTLGMVEHSLEASLLARGPKYKKPAFVKATTPPLGSGGSFAWRFEAPARVHIECSVYQTKGVVVVVFPKTKKDKKTVDSVKVVPTSVSGEAVAGDGETSVTLQASTKAPKRKEKMVNRKRAAAEARAAATAAAALAESDSERGRDNQDSDVVFHPPQNLARSAEMDAGVCRAVLSQLEEVVAAAHAAADVIVIGDVECPVLVVESSNQEECENPAYHVVTRANSGDKPSALVDEWSGTEEDDEDLDDSVDAELSSESDVAEENEIEDFQQRIIGMLKRSEDARAQHRRSFQQEQSGFDAGAAYDFFKQRFLRVQKDRQIVYAACPEPQSGSGVGVTEVVSLLSGSTA